MRRRVAAQARPVGSLYEKALLGVIVLFIVMVVTSVVITLTVPSPQTRYNLNLPNPTPPTTASPTRSPTSAPTVAPVTGAPTGPPTVAPTAAPTFPAVAITCPNDVTVTLGSSLESTFTGGAATATGGCSTPVIQYSDSIVGGSPTIFSRSSQSKKSAAPIKQVKENQQGSLAIPVELDSASLKMPVPLSLENDKKKRAAARSPSSPLSNLFLSATQSLDTATQGTGLAVSPDWVVWATDSESIAVVDRTLPGTVVASFLLSSLGTGNCSAALAGVSPQVAWDEEAQRWIMAHYSGVLPNVMCIYLSLTSDPAGSYHALAYANLTTTPSFRLAVWGRTYVITLDESTAPVPSKPLCVLDRESLLVWNDTLPLPGLFCGAALNPLTHLTYWTPVHAQVPPSASAESSGAGTPGAVFMRAIDDEYQFGETLTPLTDQLEVEHWYNLNWTVGTYGVIRYKFSVLDFVQSSPTNNACVPTPTGVFLNISYPGSLTPRLLYRRIPATGQESVVATLTSHCNGDDNVRFYWFELRWTTPTTMAFEPIWLLYQQGTSLGNDDGLHKFLPAACMDANGTIAIGYSASNNQTVYPGLWATSRLGNDPNNTLRVPISLHEGAVGSVILTPNWGPHWSMVCDPVGARWFYFSGAVSDLGNDRVTWLDRIRVLGEIVERQWRADDYCGSSANCTQYITTV